MADAAYGRIDILYSTGSIRVCSELDLAAGTRRLDARSGVHAWRCIYAEL